MTVDDVAAEMKKLGDKIDRVINYVPPEESEDLALLETRKSILVREMNKLAEMLVAYHDEVKGGDFAFASYTNKLFLQRMTVETAQCGWDTVRVSVEKSRKEIVETKVCDDDDDCVVVDDDDGEVTASSDSDDDIENCTGIYSKEKILERVGDYGYEVNDNFLFGDDVEWKFKVVLYDLYLGRFNSCGDLVDREIFPRQSRYGGTYFCGGGEYKYKLPAPWGRLHACPDVKRLEEKDVNDDGDMIASPIPCYEYETNKSVMGTFVGTRYEYITRQTRDDRTPCSSADFYHPDLLRACLRPLGVPCPFYHYYKYSGSRYDWICSCTDPVLSTVRLDWLSQLPGPAPDAYVVIPGVERRYLATKRRDKKKRKRSVGRKVYLTDGRKGRRNGRRSDRKYT